MGQPSCKIACEHLANPAHEDGLLQGAQTPHRKGLRWLLKLYEERCTAQLILARGTHGINCTNISLPESGDPHVVTSLTNGWDGPSLRRGSDVNRPPP